MNFILSGLVMCARTVVGEWTGFGEVLSRQGFCHTYPELSPLGAVLSEETLKAVGHSRVTFFKSCWISQYYIYIVATLWTKIMYILVDLYFMLALRQYASSECSGRLSVTVQYLYLLRWFCNKLIVVITFPSQIHQDSRNKDMEWEDSSVCADVWTDLGFQCPRFALTHDITRHQ